MSRTRRRGRRAASLASPPSGIAGAPPGARAAVGRVPAGGGSRPVARQAGTVPAAPVGHLGRAHLDAPAHIATRLRNATGETTLPDGKAAHRSPPKSSCAEPQAAPRLPPRGDQARPPRRRRPEREGDPPAAAHGPTATSWRKRSDRCRPSGTTRVTHRPAESHGPICRRPRRGGGAHVIHLGAGRGCGPFRCVIGIPEAAVRPPQMGLLPIAHPPGCGTRGHRGPGGPPTYRHSLGRPVPD